jgi:hypothetical protein
MTETFPKTILSYEVIVNTVINFQVPQKAEVPVQISAQRPMTILTESFHGFSQSLQASARIIS